MPTLREFIPARRAEINAAIKALRAEISELDRVERELAPATSQGEEARSALGLPVDRKTLKDMAIDVLKASPRGADANFIRDEIKKRFGVDVPRSSMSPQLSRLGSEGVLEREGFNWRLVVGDIAPTPTTQTGSEPEKGGFLGFE